MTGRAVRTILVLCALFSGTLLWSGAPPATAGTFTTTIQATGPKSGFQWNSNGWNSGLYQGDHGAWWMQLNSTPGHPVGAPGTFFWTKYGRVRSGAYLAGLNLLGAGSIGPSGNRALQGGFCLRQSGPVDGWNASVGDGGSCAWNTGLDPDFVPPSSIGWFYTPGGVGYDGFQIKATGGATGGYFAISTIQATINDTSNPIASKTAGLAVNDSKWVSGSSVPTGMSSTDAGGGIKSNKLIILDNGLQTVAQDAVSCDFTAWNPCPTSRTWNATFDSTALADGSRTAYYSVTDAGDNTATSGNFTIKTDNTKPDAPHNLAPVTNGEDGWSSDNKFGATWTNGAEEAETATQSGLKNILVDVEPTDPGMQSNPAQVTIPIGETVDGITATYTSVSGIVFPSKGRWRVRIQIVDAAGNKSVLGDDTGNSDGIIDGGFDPDAPGKPQGIANGWIGLDELRSGREQLWTLPAKASLGSADYAGVGFSVDQDENAEAPTTVTHPGTDVTSAMIPAFTPEGENWGHIRVISKNDLYGPSEKVAVRVDLTNPKGNVTGVPSTGWTNSPGQISVSGTDTMPGSGMAPGPLDNPDVTLGASIRFNVDNTKVKEDRGAAGTYNAAGLTEGPHTLKVQTFDVARNHEDQEFSFGVDRTNPSGTFMGTDPEDPTVFKVAAFDALSGPAGGQLQYAPVASMDDPAAYKNMPTFYSDGIVSGVFPDTKVPEGKYALRAFVQDAAGNNALTDKDSGGKRVVIDSSTLRDPVKMTLSGSKTPRICRKKKAKGKAAKKRALKNYKTCIKKRSVETGKDVTVRIGYGRASVLYGRLLNKYGNPITKQTITIKQSGLGMPLTTVGGATTDEDGYFTYKSPRGISRNVYATWAGTKTMQDATAVARINVATKVSFRVNPRRVRGARKFKLSGKIYADPGISKKGKLVQLQFWNPNRKKWQAGPALVRTNASGKFTYTYKIKTKPASAERIKFRAYVPVETSWAYANGYSGVRTVIHYRG
jgi:hypothetical protein